MLAPLKTPREWVLAGSLLLLWAMAFLPNLRTNPNWYGDEGEWMDASWTFIHGHPRMDAVRNDFVFPSPYPPFYLLVNGTLLRILGRDIWVGRVLGAITALAAAGVLFWMGTRLRDRWFGCVCAAGFLVCPEIVMNFRWVRSHPMAGTLVLASAGFLVRYVQEKRLRDVACAGVFSTLAVATNYWAYPMAAAVFVTALFVNRRHGWVAISTAASFPILLVCGYAMGQTGGFDQFVEQFHRLGAMSSGGQAPTLLGEAARVYRNLVSFALLTPTIGADGTQGIDLWILSATLGIVLFPIARFRKWMVLWLLAACFAGFKGRDNLPVFLYPAMIFLPLMAVGFAGLMVKLGEWIKPIMPRRPGVAIVPAVVAVSAFGLVALNGSLNHFRTKVDRFAVYSPDDAEEVMQFVNARTTDEDYVIVPKHLSWLARTPRHSMIQFSPSYEGQTTGMWPVPIPRDMFWFDCRWQNAKYIVLSLGRDAGGQPYGFDAVFSMGFEPVRKIVQTMREEKWPVVMQKGEFMVLANPRWVKQ